MRDRVFSKIEAELQRTLDAVLLVTGTERVACRPTRCSPVRSGCAIPMSIPMSLIQVDLLRRKRAGEDTPEVNRAIAGTINGIAAGLRNTG